MTNTPVRDTYGRTVAAGWGTADTGEVWSTFGSGGALPASDWSVNGAAGLMSVPVAVAYRAAYLPAWSDADVDVVTTVQVNRTPVVGGPIEVGAILLRGRDINTYSMCRVHIETTGAITAHIYNAAGTELASVTVAGLTYTGTSQQIRVRARAVGTMLRMRVWDASTPQPAAWTLIAADASYTGPGWVGVRSGVAAGNTNTLPVTFSYDDFTASPAGLFPVSPLDATIKIAFGADLKANPNTWVYVDVTADWLADRDLSAQIGRGDATSKAQTSKLSLWLKNPKGDYTKGHPMSKWWPYVRKNTPCRVTLDPGTPHTRQYDMYVSQWIPRWGDGKSGQQPLVQIVANGIRRRLTKGASPLRSVLFRSTVAAKPAAYWSLEEEATSQSFAEALGRQAMTWAGGPPKRGSGGPPGSAPLVTLAADTTLVGNVQPYTETTAGWWGVQTVLRVPDAQGQDVPILNVYMDGGTYSRWQLWWGYYTGPGGFYWIAYDQAGVASAQLAGAYSLASFPDGHGWGHDIIVGYNIHQNGANIALDGAFASPDDPAGTRLTATATVAGTNGKVTRVEVPFSSGYPHTNWVVGHISVWPGQFSLYANQMYGYDGETVHDRMVRLCTEEGVPATISTGATIKMGPQRIDTFMGLMEDGEAADGGILLDGLGPGFNYLARSDAYNLPVALTIDMAGRQFRAPFEPMDDDVGLVNDETISRVNGSKARYIDATGPAGTLAIERYDDSKTLNVFADADLPGQAAWRAHIGTAGGDGLRFPGIGFDLHVPQNAALIEPWMLAGVRKRVQAINPPATYGPGPLDLLIEGYTETVRSRRVLSVAANTSPYDPWRVFVVNTDRVDGDGYKLAAGVNATAVTLSVASTTGLLWGTTADPASTFPYDIEVAGIRIRVTAVSGTTSPQTFTVTRSMDGFDKPLPANAPVRLWHPPTIAL